MLAPISAAADHANWRGRTSPKGLFCNMYANFRFLAHFVRPYAR